MDHATPNPDSQCCHVPPRDSTPRGWFPPDYASLETWQQLNVPPSDSTQEEIDHLNSRVPATILAFVILSCAISLLIGCAKKAVPETIVDPVMLDSVVVANYEGKKLASVCAESDREGKIAEQIDIDEYRLGIFGSVASPQVHTCEEMLRLPHYQKSITLESVEGWAETIVFEGVLVSDVIGNAGPLPEAHQAVFRSQDGFEASCPIDSLLRKKILLGFAKDGAPLTPEGGYPFLLVAESIHGPDWVKWVTEMELR